MLSTQHAPYTLAPKFRVTDFTKSHIPTHFFSIPRNQRPYTGGLWDGYKAYLQKCSAWPTWYYLKILTPLLALKTQ